MRKLPKPVRPRKRGFDWPITIVVGAIVIGAAIVVGSLLAGLVYP